MLITNKEFTHDLDSPAYIKCPNENCSVGRTSLDMNIDEDGTIQCEWCESTFKLKMEIMEINES